MDNYLQRDSRIEDGTPLRDLEKKLHWALYQLSQAGLLKDLRDDFINVPDDLPNNDVFDDASEVARNAHRTVGRMPE